MIARACDGDDSRSRLGASNAVWPVQTRSEQQRRGRKLRPGLSHSEAGRGAQRLHQKRPAGAFESARAPALRVPRRRRHPEGLHCALEHIAAIPWGCDRVSARKSAHLRCAVFGYGIASIGKPMKPASPCAVARASAVLLGLSILPVLAAPRALRPSRSDRNAPRDQS